jgi:hypothetical protein
MGFLCCYTFLVMQLAARQKLSVKIISTGTFIKKKLSPRTEKKAKFAETPSKRSSAPGPWR